MKCPNCGAELTDDTKFCSFCGQKIEVKRKSSPPPTEEPAYEPEEEESPKEKKGNNATPSSGTKLASKYLDKTKEVWNELNRFNKVSSVAIAVFVLLCLVAFFAGKIFAGIIAVVQIAIVVIAILMKKEIIKVSDKRLPLLALIISLAFIIPYMLLFNVDMSKTQRYRWSDIVMRDVIPEPNSHYGKIISNSDDFLSLYVYKTSEAKYADYIDNCKENGFTVDIEQSSYSFDAFNESGYKLSIYFYESDTEMQIELDAAEELETLKWSDSALAKLVPIPESTVGMVETDDETEFSAQVGETSLEDYTSYVAACSDMGFTVDASKKEKSFFAKNDDSYRISVDYQGNNTMRISVYEPEYDVSLEIDCVKNWFFSTYDVKVYVDDLSEGTLKHGGNDIYDVTLIKGSHTISFESAEDDSKTGKIKVDIFDNDTIKLKLYCTSSGIDVTDETESDEDDTTSVENENTTESTTVSTTEETTTTTTEITKDETTTTTISSITSNVLLPEEGSKLAIDYDSKSDSTVYYINTDEISNIPKVVKWKSAYVTDGVSDYIDYLTKSGFTVSIDSKDYREPYDGFHLYETNFSVKSKNTSWTMFLCIQDEDFVEYELDINIQ